MMKAILIAFSTYSKIPMPHFKWDPKALQYSMCAFPLVGAVIGAGEFAIWYLFGFLLQWSEVFTAALLTIFPILITGGIHMDGFLDTVDAKSSYKSKEEKLQILKDPHTGAFAIIRGCLYFLIYFGCMYELVAASSVKLAAGVQTAGTGGGCCEWQSDNNREGWKSYADAGGFCHRIRLGTYLVRTFGTYISESKKRRHAGRYRTPCK